MLPPVGSLFAAAAAVVVVVAAVAAVGRIGTTLAWGRIVGRQRWALSFCVFVELVRGLDRCWWDSF